jgi:hypothetical protein
MKMNSNVMKGFKLITQKGEVVRIEETPDRTCAAMTVEGRDATVTVLLDKDALNVFSDIRYQLTVISRIEPDNPETTEDTKASGKQEETSYENH